MTQRGRQLRQTFLLALLLFIGSLLAVTAYTLWRLRADAIASGFEMAAMHSRRFEDLLTQSLLVTELVATNTLVQSPGSSDPLHNASIFVTTLGRAPFLRSLSLLDAQGRIVTSSNLDNLGITVTTESYLPPSTGVQEILRIGQPWVGRDFADGRPGRAQTAEETEASTFIPVTQTLPVGERALTLLVALNPDYFLDHMSEKFDVDEGRVEILRYDGTLLMSTDPGQVPGSRHDPEVRRLQLGETEFGSFEQELGDHGQMLTAFRASDRYPLVVITHIRREFALRHWETEAKALLGVVIPASLLVLLLAFAFYRRQLLLIAQRSEYERLQHINATVFDSSPEAILIAGLDARIISINPAFTRVTGYRPDEVIGRSLVELLTAEGIVAVRGILSRQKAAPGVPAGIEVQQRCKDGRLIWTEILSTPIFDAQGALAGYHRICRNITERREMADQVRQLAFHDPLTQLPNRRLLNDRLNQTMAASKRNACYAALMFLDLDNFKPLNDTHGHEVGDLLLIEVAVRLKSCVREMDTVARFGGDEFVVILSALSGDEAESRAQSEIVAEKIRTTLSAPYVLNLETGGAAGSTVEHRCTICIGVVVFINHETSREDILKWADTAMYQAKADGRNTIRFHEPTPVRT